MSTRRLADELGLELESVPVDDAGAANVPGMYSDVVRGMRSGVPKMAANINQVSYLVLSLHGMYGFISLSRISAP
jgi:hypothetical protein